MLRLLLVLAAAPAFAAEPFAYAGIGLDATAGNLRPKFPNSKVTDDYVYVADKDSRDHVYGVQLPGVKKPRSVRVGFERPGGPRPGYPKCKVVEARLRDGLRRAARDPQPRRGARRPDLEGRGRDDDARLLRRPGRRAPRGGGCHRRAMIPR